MEELKWLKLTNEIKSLKWVKLSLVTLISSEIRFSLKSFSSFSSAGICQTLTTSLRCDPSPYLPPRWHHQDAAAVSSEPRNDAASRTAAVDVCATNTSSPAHVADSRHIFTCVLMRVSAGKQAGTLWLSNTHKFGHKHTAAPSPAVIFNLKSTQLNDSTGFQSLPHCCGIYHRGTNTITAESVWSTFIHSELKTAEGRRQPRPMKGERRLSHVIPGPWRV